MRSRPTVPEGAFDLILCNEMVGDLPAIQLSRADVGLALDGTGNADPALVRTHSPLAAELELKLDDAPEPFYLQTGAHALVARIAKWLAPGGTAIVTEFGDTNAWPRLSTHLDHPELSTHFGQLLQVAKASGLTGGIEFVIDLLDFDRDQKGLATTRSQFRALRALAADSEDRSREDRLHARAPRADRRGQARSRDDRRPALRSDRGSIDGPRAPRVPRADRLASRKLTDTESTPKSANAR